MCGITGYLWPPGQPQHLPPREIVQAMMAAIGHRGPDSQGQWLDEESGIALGHLRLAIVDLSIAGHQPMVSASGRYQMVYNGEVYNHRKLRTELEEAGQAPDWRGHSDTEVILRGLEVWGLDETLARCQGMFAIALWDRQSRTLTLARDRLGEKPLYYGWQGAGRNAVFLFGSELKALRAHPGFDPNLNRDALVAMLRHGHVPEDLSIYAGISKLRPGEIAELSLDARTPTLRRYWDGGAMAAAPRDPAPTPAEATDMLEALLLDSVGQQMLSDVPIGAFLSGGIDSATIVALMQHLSDQPVHTFSIGFHEKRYNEATFARDIASHLGTLHTELYVGDAELRNVVPELPKIYDEPFADSSQIPTYLVAKLAHEHVTVALSGDGGDELFGGYDRYQQGAWLMGAIRRIPQPLRVAGASAVRAVPAGVYNRMMGPFSPTPEGKEPVGQRLHRLADIARSHNIEEMHRKLVTWWQLPDAVVVGGKAPPSILADHPPPRGSLCDTERMMQLDMLAYMPDDILCKVDRATMAVALESRAPLLDHRVAEFAWGLPLDLKIREGRSKWVLREVLYRHVPREMMERPKMGFEVPIGLWLRGCLRDWAGDLLDRERLARDGVLDADLIEQMWVQHLSGSHNWGRQLWNLLMFLSWRDTYS